MRRVFALFLLLLLAGCVSGGGHTIGWSAKRIAASSAATILLRNADGETVGRVKTARVRQLMAIKKRIERAAGISSRLLIVEGDQPNAFAWTARGENMVAFNLKMLAFLGNDADAIAFVFGHEIAHDVKRHGEASRDRDLGLTALGTAVGFGISLAGVPMGGTLADLGADAIKSKFSRDQEREADALGIRYMIAGGFDPRGAIRFHRALLAQGGSSAWLAFLSTHPTGRERIANLKSIIAAEGGAASAEPERDKWSRDAWDP